MLSTDLTARHAHQRVTVIALAFAIAAAGAFACIAACPQAADAKSAPSLYTWKEKKAPNYLVEWGKAKGAAKAPKKGKIKYSKLDKLGRTRTAKATITYKMVKKALDRGKLPIPYEMKPSGWKRNAPVSLELADGTRYQGYFWNRSHLIADSLGGAVKLRNLVTGTRTQNVGYNDDAGGIAFCESKARTWLLHHHKGTVYYSVKPVYKGKELVPRSLVVDMQSSDKTLNARYVVYNAMHGYKINYKTGNFKQITPAPAKIAWPRALPDATAYTSPTGVQYHSHKLCDGLAFASRVVKTTCSVADENDKYPCPLCWSN